MKKVLPDWLVEEGGVASGVSSLKGTVTRTGRFERSSLERERERDEGAVVLYPCTILIKARHRRFINASGTAPARGNGVSYITFKSDACRRYGVRREERRRQKSISTIYTLFISTVIILHYTRLRKSKSRLNNTPTFSSSVHQILHRCFKPFLSSQFSGKAHILPLRHSPAHQEPRSASHIVSPFSSFSVHPSILFSSFILLLLAPDGSAVPTGTALLAGNDKTTTTHSSS